MPKSTFFNLPDAKKKHIMDVAFEEFSKVPYQEISINDMIEKMDIPTGSFYQYFEDKKDLYFYVLSFFIDGLMEESKTTKIKIDLLDPVKNFQGTSVFTETRKNMKYYEPIFVKNFNKAPLEIKRDWTFDNIVGKKYMDLYDYTFFEGEDIDPKVKEHKYLMMSLVMTIPTLLQRFSDRQKNFEEYSELYRLCLDVLKAGFANFKSV